MAERYDVSKEDAYKSAEDRIVKSTKEEMLSSALGYASKVVTNCDISLHNDNCEYVMLPVYMVNVKYKDKFYIFAMNGESGEFVGNIPLDKKKAVIMSILLFIIIFVFILIISYIVFKFGGSN